MDKDKPENGIWQDVAIYDITQEPNLFLVRCPHNRPLTKILAAPVEPPADPEIPEGPWARMHVLHALPPKVFQRLRIQICVDCRRELDAGDRQST